MNTTTTLPALMPDQRSLSEKIAELWRRIEDKLYVSIHTLTEVKAKLFAETKEFPDGDSHFVITELIKKCESNGKLLDAIMQEQKSYSKAFDYFYSKSQDYGYKSKYGYYLDNQKALELAEEYFLLDDVKEYYDQLLSQIKDERVKEQIQLEFKFDGDMEKYRRAIKQEVAFETKLKKENPDEYKARYEKKKKETKKSVSKKAASKKKSVKPAVETVKEIGSTTLTKEAKVTEKDTAVSAAKEASSTKATAETFSQMSIWDLM